MESVIELSVRRISEAYEKALTMSVDEETFRDFDPLWMDIWLDQWNRMPEKIQSSTRYGQIHIHVYWDQYFKISAYPKKLFPSLADLLCFLRFSADQNNEWLYRRIFPHNMSLPETLSFHQDLWAIFLSERKTVELGGSIYIDIADLLQGQSAFIWDGHWKFEDVVLDRYLDGEIDYNSYYASHFRTEESSLRFQKFQNFMQSIGMNREKTWTLFTPSGERVYKIISVVAWDGNSNRVLLEGENEFLDILAFGS